MTRKDYEMIAGAFREAGHVSAEGLRPDIQRTGRYHVASALADVLARDNPRFDRDRFLAACGVL